MSEILSILTQALGGNATRQIGQLVGADESQTQNALSAVVPLLLSGLAKNAAQPDGASALLGALNRDHDGSALDDLPGLLGSVLSGGTPAANTPQADGAGILAHVLGNRQDQAKQAVAKAGGFDPATAAKLMAIAAPIVMAALGRMQRQKGLDANGLSNYLGGERKAMAVAQPGLMGLAEQLLDANHDGNAMDEIGGMVGKLFGGR